MAMESSPADRPACPEWTSEADGGKSTGRIKIRTAAIINSLHDGLIVTRRRSRRLAVPYLGLWPGDMFSQCRAHFRPPWQGGRAPVRPILDDTWV